MVRAFAEGSERILPEHVVSRPTGIASAILRGNPARSYPYTRTIVLESNGAFLSVSETEIREARAMMAELAGVSGCFTSAAALAGVRRAARQGIVSPTETVLVNVTGRDRRPIPPAAGTHWLASTPVGWIPEHPADVRARALCGDRPLSVEDATAGPP
jgi:threonine synthase